MSNYSTTPTTRRADIGRVIHCAMTKPATRVAATAFIALSTLVTGGCQTLSDNTAELNEFLVPEISGVVHKGGRAATELEIFVARNEGQAGLCERPLQSVLTDTEGRFVAPAMIRKAKPQTLNRIENDWQVCAMAAGKMQQLWFGRHSGVLFSDIVTQLDCDLGLAGKQTKPVCKQL